MHAYTRTLHHSNRSSLFRLITPSRFFPRIQRRVHRSVPGNTRSASDAAVLESFKGALAKKQPHELRVKARCAPNICVRAPLGRLRKFQRAPSSDYHRRRRTNTRPRPTVQHKYFAITLVHVNPSNFIRLFSFILLRSLF